MINIATNYIFIKNDRKDKQLYGKRIKSFNKFNKKYINTQKINSLSDIEDADYFVIGSDQVWNAEWYRDDSITKELYLLTFTTPEKKICFSPSFGIEKLPSKWVPWFKKNLNQFNNISVREDAGAKIVKELTGRSATVLIDPTMMLDASEWSKIAEKPKNVDSDVPYILSYFLGGRSERVNNDLQKYAKENNMKVYNLLDYTQPDMAIINPSEFIYMINHAKLVLTDSFHACVFSFLFKIPFLVYPRQGSKVSMMSRIDTLLSKFKLERKYIYSGKKNEIFECNYEEGFAQLKIERNKVIDYLKGEMFKHEN